MHLEGSVVDEDIQPPQLFDRLGHGLSAMVSVSDIAGKQNAAPPLCLHCLPRNFGIGVLIKVGNSDVGSFARKQNGDRAPDPGVSAGDQRHLSLKLLRAEIERRVIHGRRFKLRFRPGLWLVLFWKRRFRIVPGSRLHGASLALQLAVGFRHFLLNVALFQLDLAGFRHCSSSL